VSAVYLDTSVLVAYYVPEVHSTQAETAILGAGDRVVSSLCLSEAAAALRTKVHNGVLTRDQGISARDQFITHYQGGFYRLEQMSERHFEHAAAIVWQVPVPIRALDALHLAVVQLAGMRLATADGRLRDAARATQVAVDWLGA
jgi:predicted nucleic acid-binding protein